MWGKDPYIKRYETKYKGRNIKLHNVDVRFSDLEQSETSVLTASCRVSLL